MPNDYSDYDVVPLSNAGPLQLNIGEDDRARYAVPEQASSLPRLSEGSKGMGGSRSPGPTARVRPQPAARPATPQHRALSPDELLALANAMQARIASQTAAIPKAQVATQPAVDRKLGY